MANVETLWTAARAWRLCLILSTVRMESSAVVAAISMSSNEPTQDILTSCPKKEKR